MTRMLRIAEPRRPALKLRTAEEASSILSALPFFPDPDHEAALAMLPHAETRESRWSVAERIEASLSGITTSSGCGSARSTQKRAVRHNLDRRFMLSGWVRRLTARLPGTLTIGRYRSPCRTVADCLADRRVSQRALFALHAAEERAAFKIGKGLLDAAAAMLDGGLLDEAEIFFGQGGNSPPRLRIRDAVFASEDLTLEEMAWILMKAPYDIANLQGDPDPCGSSGIEMSQRTPLIFVHCDGFQRNLQGGGETVLEAVDFGSVDALEKCNAGVRKQHDALLLDVQGMLSEIAEDTTSRMSGRRPRGRGAR